MVGNSDRCKLHNVVCNVDACTLRGGLTLRCALQFSDVSLDCHDI